MHGLIRYFADKTILANLLVLFILIFGFWNLQQINKEGYPKVDRKRIYITTIFPGASPEEVESGVTIPIENALSGIEGILKYVSVSQENVSRITVYIDPEYKELEKVKADIRRAVDNITLPKEVTKNPAFFEWKVSQFPVIEVAIFSDTLSYAELRTRALDLEKKLKTIPYVSGIIENAILDREIKIKLDLKKLNDNYISVQEVINAIQINNFEITGGSYNYKNEERLLTVTSKLKTIKDIQNVIIRSTFEGNKIYLKDIAKIEDGFEDKSTVIHLNGQQGVSLMVQKKDNADIMRTVDAVKAAVKEYQLSLGKTDLDFTYIWDLSAETRNRLEIVQTNAIMGLVLVLLVLFLLMDAKNAIWTAMGIPTAVAFAVIMMPLFGVTINSVSLLGIVVVMGMVVDDAIVISENIYRHRLMGKSPIKASIDGTIEVAYPVIGTVITTIVAFVPLYTLKGIIGDFAKEIPFVVIAVLAGSLIEALLILPNHLNHNWFGKMKPASEMKERKFMVALRRGYEKSLNFVLKWYILLILVFGGLFYVSYYVLFSGHVLKFIPFPSNQSTHFEFNGEVTDGQMLNFTLTKVKKIEEFLSVYPTNVMVSYVSSVGELGFPEKFHMEVNLTPDSVRKIKADDIISNLRVYMDDVGGFTNVVFAVESGGPPMGRAIRIEIIGNDNLKRKEIADIITKYLLAIDGVYDIVRSDEENKKATKVMINYDMAAKVGVSPIVIAQTVRTAFHGVIASSLQTPEDLVNYRVVLDDMYKNKLGTLNQLYVMNFKNVLITLPSLIIMKDDKLVSKIDHYNGDRNTIIEADLLNAKITAKELYDKIVKDFGDFKEKYPGFQMEIGGEAESTQETIDSMISAAILAGVLILFILILLFRSIIQSVLVLLTVPFSLIGVAFALYTHNLPLTAMGVFGMVGLMGVVVNDAIVMVDFINAQRKILTKDNIRKLIVEGAGVRLRPVILTTVTTVAGLLPTAYGIGGSDQLVIPTVLVMAWGLMFATFLTLYLIPSFYMLDFRIRHFFKDMFAKLFRKSAPADNTGDDNHGE